MYINFSVYIGENKLRVRERQKASKFVATSC